MKVMLDIPDSWIDALMTLPVDPAEDEDTLEQRLYDAILAQVDHATERLRQQATAAGAHH